MAIRINPFHELYVGESIGPDKFVDLFSNVIVEHALSLFQPGHVILKGLPGTGKSMLLNLLKPKIRLAYINSNHEFPIPHEFRKFIGSGINLKRSGISDFGQRPIESDEDNLPTSPIYFADFLNYWLVSDTLTGMGKCVSEDQSNKLAKEIGITYNEKKLNAFAREVSRLDCWVGYLNNVNTYSDLLNAIHKRITDYRGYLNYNIPKLPENISSSKTIIGVPISKCVELLRSHEIIKHDVEVFIRIDQYEELAWLDESIPSLGSSYQEIIHKLLGMRDSNVSYRIGTRHFAWTGDKKMFGTTARLEKKRNYSEISIDGVLRRRENARTWIFPKFAEDIFCRRLKLSPYEYDLENKSLINYVFGNNLLPKDRALAYLPNDKDKAVRLEENWPEEWKKFLINLAGENPLAARLAEAWGRQKDKEKITEKPFPWDDKLWWKKERIEQALMQIASRNQQQLIWYGKDDILALSGGNILIFLSLCQHIWDVWIRDNRNTDTKDITLPKIDSVIQSVGIRETSSDWFEDIADEKGGKERKAFINYLGTHFYKKLVEDKAMSYPGHNGFSMTTEDIQKNEKIHQFLKDASDYGDLYDGPHTSKSSDKKQRHKWYLNPILSPHFKIPYAHTKEPIYVNMQTLTTWLIESNVFEEEEFLKKKSKKTT